MKHKLKYKQLYQACRNYWNEYDPIGVWAKAPAHSSPEWYSGDEYDSYIPFTVKLVMNGADATKFRKHIEHCCHVNMGLAQRQSTDKPLAEFVEKLINLQNP